MGLYRDCADHMRPTLSFSRQCTIESSASNGEFEEHVSTDRQV